MSLPQINIIELLDNVNANANQTSNGECLTLNYAWELEVIKSGTDGNPKLFIERSLDNIYSHLTTGTTIVIDNYYNNTNADQIFSYSGTIGLPSSGVDNNVLLFVNPLGSGKNLVITRLYFGDTVTNNLIFMRLFANPTVTANGTLQASRNNKIGSVVNSVALVYSQPTTTSNGNEIRNGVNGRDQNSFILEEKGKIVLPPNNSLLITGRPTSNNRAMNLNLIWQDK